MGDEIKIEFGADFKRWLIAKIILTSLVLAGVGGYLYHKVSTAAAQEAEKEHQRELGIEGTPVLKGATPEWFTKKEGNPGLQLTKIMIEGLDLRTQVVRKAETRPLPPQIGTLNYDNETQFLIKCRFNGELVHIMQVKDKVITSEAPYEKIIDRPVKFGDKVKQGDVLAEFWSVTLGTAKAAFVDGISAVRLSQDAYIRQKKLYLEGGLPLGSLKAAERQLQGDNNNLLTCERTLRMWKMNSAEIEALRKEAYEILDALLTDPTGKISEINDAGMTLVLANEDGHKKEYKFAKDCKFFQVVKREKEEIKRGGDAFKNLVKNEIGATVATNDDGEATEVVFGKVRDALDEVNRWARTQVYVPTFDKANLERQLTLVEKNTNFGDIVDNTNFGTWLFRVADMSKLAIWVHPAEEYLPLIREGMKPYWTVNADTLAKLRNAKDEQKKQRVPEIVVAKVAKLRPAKLDDDEQKLDEDQFLAKLGKELSADELKSYQRVILTYMRGKGLEWDIRMQSDPQAAPIRLPVDLICPALEPTQHNPMVVGYLPNKDHKFLAGQFVTATLQMPPEKNTAEIATTAINEYNGQSFVFVKGKEQREYYIRRVAVVRRYADYSIVRTVLRTQDDEFSKEEVAAGRYPLRPLNIGDEVVIHGTVELTTALETLLTKELIKFQRQQQ